jgi:hypothetical protein
VALIRTPAAAGTDITKFDAVSTAFRVTEPPDGAFSLMLPAMSIPYPVYEPDDVNLIIVFAPLVVIVGEPVVIPE